MSVATRLRDARKARQGRIDFGAVPTVGDLMLNALDELPEHEHLAVIGGWARYEGKALCGNLRKFVAMDWLAGVKK